MKWKYPIFYMHVGGYSGEIPIHTFSARYYCNLSCTWGVICFVLFYHLSSVTYQKILLDIIPKNWQVQNITHTHNTQHNTQKQDEPLPPYHQRLCPISPSTMASNHGTAAPHKSVAGALRWVHSQRGWSPWLLCQIKMHWKMERGTEPWPLVRRSHCLDPKT